MSWVLWDLWKEGRQVGEGRADLGRCMEKGWNEQFPNIFLALRRTKNRSVLYPESLCMKSFLLELFFVEASWRKELLQSLLFPHISSLSLNQSLLPVLSPVCPSRAFPNLSACVIHIPLATPVIVGEWLSLGALLSSLSSMSGTPAPIILKKEWTLAMASFLPSGFIK